MSIHEKLSKIYQKCKMDSLRTLLQERQEDLKHQQIKIAEAFDAPLYTPLFSKQSSSQKLIKDALSMEKRIIDDISIIKSYLDPKTYKFKSRKSARKSVKNSLKSVKKSRKSAKKP